MPKFKEKDRIVPFNMGLPIYDEAIGQYVTCKPKKLQNAVPASRSIQIKPEGMTVFDKGYDAAQKQLAQMGKRKASTHKSPVKAAVTKHIPRKAPVAAVASLVQPKEQKIVRHITSRPMVDLSAWRRTPKIHTGGHDPEKKLSSVMTGRVVKDTGRVGKDATKVDMKLFEAKHDYIQKKDKQ